MQVTQETKSSREQVRTRRMLSRFKLRIYYVYKTTIYSVHEVSTDQDYQARKAGYKYKRGKKWNVVECLRMFVTLTDGTWVERPKRVKQGGDGWEGS